MAAEVIATNENEVVLQVKVKLNGSLMEMEEAIQLAVNEVGSLATHHALKKFDTTGAPIQIGSIRMTSKGVTSIKPPKAVRFIALWMNEPAL